MSQRAMDNTHTVQSQLAIEQIVNNKQRSQHFLEFQYNRDETPSEGTKVFSGMPKIMW